ncbi:hypothetical protein [Ramlibacter sp. WS9]|uniref:hypothetical protein n=1 Tax=Ramlibacter sp. WS9 TaxID=1882741 RepID=UPI0011451B63|nr:hypothetical protein [Ramlibacter sp. WS9]ROZ78119.1 hypothetical protein EEB15_06635 [Ramlibacter sp. WS9]HSV36710.1 hypothetical protein [Ramlibacter sp.]
MTVASAASTQATVAEAAAGDLQSALDRTTVARAWLAGDFSQRWQQRVDRGGPSFVLRLAAHNPADAFVVREVFTPAFRVLQSMSHGRLSIEPVWGEGSHVLTDGWRMVRDGLIDITACYSSRSPELGFKLFQGLFLPGLFPGAHVATLVSELLYRQWLMADFDRQGVRMGRLKATAGDVVFSRRPIRALDDMRGLRISASSGWHGEIYRQLGAIVCMKTSPQVAAAIASGEIDAAAMTDGSAQVFGVDRVTRYRLETGSLGRLNLEYCVSPRAYCALPSDLRAVLGAWFSGLAQAECQVFYGVGGAQARMHFARQGMETTRLDRNETLRLASFNAMVQGRFVANLDATGLPGTRFMRDLLANTRQFGKATENDLMQLAIDSPVVGINEPG